MYFLREYSQKRDREYYDADAEVEIFHVYILGLYSISCSFFGSNEFYLSSTFVMSLSSFDTFAVKSILSLEYI